MSANIVSVDNPIKIVSTSKINKVFSTNAVNSIEVSKEKIIKSNNKLREVVEAGYLLNAINLSTVPDVIADAILQAMSDTKDAVLSDSLLSTLRTDLENLDDGVYKKTYIDNTITYLTNLLTSKVDAETVASIADSKIATASEGFAATSTVSALTSRVDSSESAIINLSETVNTKDTARANQISELEASIDESFAGYSEAIGLTVDENGVIKSQKIEEIAAQNYSAKVSINELNEITLDDKGTYTASVAKMITDSNGKTVGLKFADSNELTSFLINADTFKISNSTNDYTPFSIVDNNLLFNGKVTFSNITGGDSILTVDNVQDAINNNVTSIDGGKIVADTLLINNINALGGIIANDVYATDFYGKNFYGGYFEGALIVGSVIKASYLDLDGELELLTNYHITVATYNANPSLYADAIYSEGANEYRIPTLSKVYESQSSAVNSTLVGKLSSYATANVGHNNKAVGIRPIFKISSNSRVFYAARSGMPSGYVQNVFALGGTQFFNIKYTPGVLYVSSSIVLGEYFVCPPGSITVNGVISSVPAPPTSGSRNVATVLNQNYSKNGFTFNVKITWDYWWGQNLEEGGNTARFYHCNIYTDITIIAGTVQIGFNWTSGSLTNQAVNGTAYLGNNIYIENL